jgi:hypothetical protein
VITPHLGNCTDRVQKTMFGLMKTLAPAGK